MTDMTELLNEADPEAWMYPIFIPSYSRAGTAPLLNLLAKAPEFIQEKVYVVVRRSETKAYRRAYPWATIIPQDRPVGIGPARMLCLVHADNMGFKRIVMMDDDITKVGLLEDRGFNEEGHTKSGRYSSKNTPWEPWEFTLQALALGCKMADAVFYHAQDVAFGSTRGAFMSSAEDVRVTATIGAKGFPCCVIFIDLERFTMREMPEEFHMEGEDLAMFMDAYEEGYASFLFNTLIYDDDRGIPSTIPFSGDGEIDRAGNLADAEAMYAVLGPYLKVTNRSKASDAVWRIGVDWRRYHHDKGTSATQVMTANVISYIEEL